MSLATLSRIMQSISFRLMMLSILYFLGTISILAIILFFSVNHSLEEQLKTQISEETSQLLGDYQQDGLDELRHDIRERTHMRDTTGLYYALKRKNGKALFDDIAITDKKGWHVINHQDGNQLIMQVTHLENDYRLYVASDTALITEFRHALLSNMLALLGLILLLGLLGGVIISKRFLTRVDYINQTAQSIGRYSLSSRLPISAANDEFDQLSATINAMLDRIETLILEIKGVTHNIAHDLRTPLTSLRHELEEAAETAHISHKKILQSLVIQLDDILNIFSSMLQIAELESGVQRANFISFPLDELLAHLTETYTPIAEEHAQQLLLDCPANLMFIANKSLITQMIVNMIENAIKHSGKGSHIIIAAHRYKEKIVISVKDDGVGVDVQDLNQLAKPFFRTDSSRTTHGSGLGLSLVQAIATLHGATLHFDSSSNGFLVEITFSNK